MKRKLDSYILKFSSYRNFLWNSWMCSGVHKFSKYMWATTKDQVPEDCHETSSILRIQNFGISVHIVCKKNLSTCAEDIKWYHKKFSQPYAWDLCTPVGMECKVMGQHFCSITQIKKKFNRSEHVVSCQRAMKWKALFVWVKVVVLGHAVCTATPSCIQWVILELDYRIWLKLCKSLPFYFVNLNTHVLCPQVTVIDLNLQELRG
jgi:hypothetical protein